MVTLFNFYGTLFNANILGGARVMVENYAAGQVGEVLAREACKGQYMIKLVVSNGD